MRREEAKSLEPLLRGYYLSKDPLSLEPPLPKKTDTYAEACVRPSLAGPITGGAITLFGALLLFSLFPAPSALFSLPLIFGPIPYVRRKIKRLEQNPKNNFSENPKDTQVLLPERVEEKDEKRLSSLSLFLPEEYKLKEEAVEKMLLSFSFVSYPLGFEIVGKKEEITFQLTGYKEDIKTISSLVSASIPEVETEIDEDKLKELDNTPYVVDFGLDRESIRPIAFPKRLKNYDPLAQVVGAVSRLKQKETAGVQILFQRLKTEISKKITEISCLIEDKELLKHAKEKTKRPLFCASIRAFASTGNERRNFEILKAIGSSMEQFSKPHSNRFIPLENKEYDDFLHAKDLLLRQTRRTGLLLNSRELLGLVHPPGAEIKEPKLLRVKTKEAKAKTAEKGIKLGVNRYHSNKKEVLLPKEIRNRHFYTVGATRQGKSTLFLNMMIQDIERGEGLAVIDPHGDLINDLLPFIPKERVSDVIYFNVLDREHPIGLNPLHLRRETEKDLVCSEILISFQRLFGRSWGDRLEHILRFTLLALLEAENTTLRDIMKMLNNELFREKLLSDVSDPDVLDFFSYEFPNYSSSALLPIKNKVGRFLSVSCVRNIVAQEENKIDFKKIFNDRKILLVSIPHGAIGEDNSKLLGSLVVSKIQLAAIQRVKIKKGKRKNFYLYCDEFQNFMSGPSFSKILSEAGKYKLCLNMAHQYTSQLPKRVRDALFGNVGTIICFRVGPKDAKFLTKVFGERFSKEDILSLSQGETFVKMGSSQNSFNMKTFPPPKSPEKDFIDEIVENSRNRYAQKREEVERKLFNKKGQNPKEPQKTSFRF